jgi:phosphoribosylglycinamide formyltransferase-1
MKNIAVFASGSGTNFEAIVNAVENNMIKDAKVSLMVCDKKDAYAITRANNHNVETFVFNAKDYKSKEEFEAIIVKKLDELKIDLVCLAGYMRYIGKVLLDSYEGRIINIHPALLPSFKGAHGIKDAFDYGVKVYGVTVHYVDSGVDSGKIIMQRGFEYYGNDIDELESKIHDVEHVLYIEAINKVLYEENK